MKSYLFATTLLISSCQGYHGACDDIGSGYRDSFNAALLADGLKNTECCGNHPGYEGDGAAYKEAQDVVGCSDYYQDLVE